jgi:wyosine [tRNA(Phe)-imidazoG37] synthetase (radical SAM superfamily)
MIAFGPVPSRRLGQSLGVNNIPPKVCTYSCIYCQVGRTKRMQVQRQQFYPPEEILRAVTDKLQEARRAGERVDYLTFVPDGEPTLDVHLGREIELLKPLGVPIAVISNASLVTRADVRDELLQADWVSLKIDSVREQTWRRINRPHVALDLRSILDGILRFAENCPAALATETMLVQGVNDTEGHADELADFLVRLWPVRAYVSIPTRPPAEERARAPSEEGINRFYQTLTKRIRSVECLIGYEGNAFATTGDVVDDMLSITAVHPMREAAVRDLLARANADWSVIRALVAQGSLVETVYDGQTFYVRRIPTAGRVVSHGGGALADSQKR